MAFNWSTFRTRALTAIVFVAVMVTGLFWNRWSYLLLFSVIHFGAWWEYLRLTEKITGTAIHPYAKMGWMVAGYAIVLFASGDFYALGGYSFGKNFPLPVSAAGFALIVLGIFQQQKLTARAAAMAAAGVLYISIPVASMVDMAHSFCMQATETLDEGEVFTWYLPAFIIGCIWINDTMAYIVGSLIGRTPLSKISPKKTWEGTIGGILLTVAVAWLVCSRFQIGTIQEELALVLSLAIAVTGTIGDLFESKLKRMAGVKDSGHFMPGHGGFLDRFDSLLFAAPCCWLLTQCVQH